MAKSVQEYLALAHRAAGLGKKVHLGKFGQPLRHRPKRIVLTERHLEFINMLLRSSGKSRGRLHVPMGRRRHRRFL